MMPVGDAEGMNREWHLAHVLGSKAPMDRRVEWHLEHVQVCGCAPIPLSVLAAIERRGLDVPERARGGT